MPNGTCGLACPNYYYGETSSQICSKCSSFCSNCIGPSSSDCSSCSSNMYLTNITTCQSCDPSCLTCSGPNNYSCQSCPNAQILVNGTCLTSPSSISVTLSLELTSDPSTINLNYDQQLLNNVVASISTAFVISITVSKQHNFTYTISNSQHMITIKFNFTTYIPLNTPIFVDFDTTEFSNLESNTIYLISPKNLTINSLEFILYNPGEQNMIASSQATAQTTTSLSQTNSNIQTILNSQSAVTYLLIQNYELFNAVAYLDINYPPNLMMLFSKLENNLVSVSYLVNILDNSISLINTEEPVRAPGKFGLYGLKSNITLNFGGQIYQFFIMLTISAILISISRIPVKLPEIIKNIAFKIFYFFVWNFVLSFVISSYFKLVMFTMLHYTTAVLESSYQALNMIILITCTILLLLPGLTAFLTFSNLKKNQDENNKTPNERINVLSKNFKQNSLIIALYPTINLIRGFIIYFSLVCMRNYLKITLVIWTFTSLFMIIYLIIFKPFKKFRHNINQIGCEFFTLFIYLMAIIQSQFNESDKDKKSNLGFRMLLMNDGFYIWNIIISYLELAFLAIEAIIEHIKSKKEAKAKAKAKADEANLENVVLTLIDDKDLHDFNTEVLIEYFL